MYGCMEGEYSMSDILKAINYLKDRKNDQITDGEIKYYQMAIDALKNQLSNGWISVEEELPEAVGNFHTSRVVWCIDAQGKTGFGIYSRELRREGWFLGGGVGDNSVRITHWMPLPKPPVKV